MSRTCLATGFLEEAGRILYLDRRWTCLWPLVTEGSPEAPIKGTNGFPSHVP